MLLDMHSPAKTDAEFGDITAWLSASQMVNICRRNQRRLLGSVFTPETPRAVSFSGFDLGWRSSGHLVVRGSPEKTEQKQDDHTCEYMPSHIYLNRYG